MDSSSYNKKIKLILLPLLALALAAGVLIPEYQKNHSGNPMLYLFIVVVFIVAYYVSGLVMKRQGAYVKEADEVMKQNGFSLVAELFQITQLKHFEITQNYAKKINNESVQSSLVFLQPFRDDPGTPAIYFHLNVPLNLGKVLVTLPSSAMQNYIKQEWLASLAKVEFETTINNRLVLAEKNSPNLWQFFDPIFLDSLTNMPKEADLIIENDSINFLLWDYKKDSVVPLLKLIEKIIARKR